MDVVNQFFGSQIFLKFETVDDQKYAWVVNENAITQYKWVPDPPLPPLNRKIVLKMDKKLVAKEFCFSEVDPSIEYDKKSSIKERMYQILSDKERKKQTGKVTAVLHKQNTRCTIVAESQNWFTFQLKDDMAL